MLNFKVNEVVQLEVQGESDLLVTNYLKDSYIYDVELQRQHVKWDSTGNTFSLVSELSVILTNLADASKVLVFEEVFIGDSNDTFEVVLSARDISRHSLTEYDFEMLENIGKLIQLNMYFSRESIVQV